MEATNILEDISDFIFTSKYSRYDEKLGRREMWEESVGRLEKMHLKKYSFLSKEDKEKIKLAFNLVRAKRVVPSMRSLQFGGKAIEAHNARIFNCSVTHIHSLRSFAEVFYLLLCGCGVGIGLNKEFLGRLPDLVDASNKSGTVLTYVVEDTIEGWADSVEALMMCYFRNTPYTGRKIVFDFSKIRPKGTPLKTGGGKAPGYKGLKNALQKVKHHLDHIIEHKNLPRLRTIDAYDILMHTADAVLSGGVRRSATSVIFESDDEAMINSKTYLKVDKKWSFDQDGQVKLGNTTYNLYVGKVQVDGLKYDVTLKDFEYKILQENGTIFWKHIYPQRARSNNSILILRGKTTFDEFQKILIRTREFGEPGFVFADHAHQLFNPCQPNWAPILTPEGIKPLGEVNIGDKIWSETGWTNIVKKWSTGTKKVYKYETNAGVFYGTENHRLISEGVKIEAKDCESVDSLVGPEFLELAINHQDVMDGLVLGDGSVHVASNNLVHLCIGANDLHDYLNSQGISKLIKCHRPGIHDYAYEINTTINADELPSTPNRVVPRRFFHGSPSKVAGFLRGLFSANGSICGNRITLKTTSARLREDVQIMLSSLGIRSYFTTNKAKLNEFSNGIYSCRESYDVNISGDRKKFAKLIGFIHGYKSEKLFNLVNTIDSKNNPKITYDINKVELISEEEVFDITVENLSHTYWTGGVNVSNCFEIGFVPVLDSGVCGVQFCNLTSMNGASIKSQKDFEECCIASAIIGTLQAGYTQFPYLSKASEELTKGESLLGCSITGVMDSSDVLLNDKNQRRMAELINSVNGEWAKKLGINPAARTTCIKPEGTSSLVLGCASGIHFHHAKKYFRRVQCNKLDPVYKYFKQFNPHVCEPSVWSENHTDDVVIFPIQVSDNVKVKSDVKAIEHLNMIRSTQQNWVIPGATASNTRGITNNVSCTVIVQDNEWDDVSRFIFDNQNYFSAISLLSSFGDKIYPQAPMEAITTEEDMYFWNKIVANWKKVDYSHFKESGDQTNLSSEMVCAGGACEIVTV